MFQQLPFARALRSIEVLGKLRIDLGVPGDAKPEIRVWVD
jgi:hypothetical protein